MSFMSKCLLFCVLSISAVVAYAEQAGTARFDRTSLVVRDMDESMAFWRDVMGFEVRVEPRVLPPQENDYLGWSKETTKVTFAHVRSPEGAGVGLLEIQDKDFPSLNTPETPAAYGGVIMVFVAKDIDALYQRAVEADAVFKPLTPSPTGLSKQMYLRSPGGYLLEVYELLPKEPE